MFAADSQNSPSDPTFFIKMRAMVGLSSTTLLRTVHLFSLVNSPRTFVVWTKETTWAWGRLTIWRRVFMDMNQRWRSKSLEKASTRERKGA